MAFQTTVFLEQGFGVPGELFNDGPVRAQSWIIDSADAAYNIIGATCFSVTNETTAAAGNVGGTAIFAGFLVSPKTQASYGTVAGTLTPTLTLADQVQADLLTMGTIVVTLPAAAAIGDLVVYDNTTGAISTIVPGADLPVGKSFAYAVVSYRTVSGAGLAVVTVSPTLIIPVLA